MSLKGFGKAAVRVSICSSVIKLDDGTVFKTSLNRPHKLSSKGSTSCVPAPVIHSALVEASESLDD